MEKKPCAPAAACLATLAMHGSQMISPTRCLRDQQAVLAGRNSRFILRGCFFPLLYLRQYRVWKNLYRRSTVWQNGNPLPDIKSGCLISDYGRLERFLSDAMGRDNHAWKDRCRDEVLVAPMGTLDTSTACAAGAHDMVTTRRREHHSKAMAPAHARKLGAPDKAWRPSNTHFWHANQLAIDMP
ncbi:hypothetical protein CJ030_MR6G025418 [Morella rubra]|uniref:Uncharacterized protein n=1 Tax=Morella rubra TaxID=262757 RepID=A0A6A1VCG0_9ROSI|nr:hypothetical protein CJ030_MR6G025418 [Morella rubra]